MEAAQDLDLATNDLGPLAWVLDELRKSLDSASSALRRFVRDASLARGRDMASVDDGQLRIARQHMHQAVGALEMVGLGAPAHMLRAMEGAVQKFIERPELCNETSSAKVERAGFALTEYLESVLLGKQVSAVALFPQYKDIQEIAGADRNHPADLWMIDWRWIEPQTPAVARAMVYDPAVRSRMDQAVLRIVKTADAQAARELAETCLSLAASQSARQPKIFWKLAAGYFEAISLKLLPPDVYSKRAASRVLLQYASLAKGELGVSDRLAQDLVFFCAQAVPATPLEAPALASVRSAYGLQRFKPVDYATSPFGRFDPVLLAQARKRIAAARESWSALSGGDTTKLKAVGDQFNNVAESLGKLYTAGAPLALALAGTVDTVTRSARPPSTELAMEVATAILYLEAVVQDFDPSDPLLPARIARLAERLETVRSGGAPEPLETWMEELYRHVSDRQTMGSVVGELRSTLSELEKLLDQFFRDPKNKAPLRDAPSHLSQMRGVLSVLGLEQASHAVLRMRDTVEEIIVTEVDEQQARAAGTFDKLGNNLGALGFLIDMLNYQPALAKKLFVYDDSTGELRPLMGRSVPAQAQEPHHEDEQGALSDQVNALVTEAGESGMGQLTAKLDTIATQAVLSEHKGVAQAARDVAAAVTAQDKDATAAALTQLAAAVQPPVSAPKPAPQAQADFVEDDLRDIFLEEAREVVGTGMAAVQALAAEPGNLAEMTTLRRAFHTLKGSSRMVGLTVFGDAAWSLEQVLNTWLADQKSSNDDLRALSADALRAFGSWVEDIAHNRDSGWAASMFIGPADALRMEQRLVRIQVPHAGDAEPAVQAPAATEPMPLDAFEPASASMPDAFDQTITFDLGDAGTIEAAVAEPVAEPVVAEELDLSILEFASPLPVQAEPPAPAPAPAVSHPALERTQKLEPIAVELPAESPPDFDFEFDMPTAPVAAAPAEPPLDIAGIDFDSLAGVSGVAAAQPEPVPTEEPQPEPVVQAEALEVDFDAWEAEQQAVAAVPAQAEPTPAEAEYDEAEQAEALNLSVPREEQIRVIGTLRIGIPLYNVYLNEADEWSRRLVSELGEWVLEMNQRVPDSTVGWAHALAGSSATVGFHALSDIARALEAALMQAQQLSNGTPVHAHAFTEAAEEIRRLLHQFAAGFLKEPNPQVIASLHALKSLQGPSRSEPEPMEFEDAFDNAVVEAVEAEPEAAVFAVAVPQPEPQPQPAPALQVQHRPAAPPVATFTVSQDRDDEDLDVTDAIDPDLFPIFEEEAAELMPQLGSALRQWAARPDNMNARGEALRVLHTLKGSARLAGALRMGELAHRLESDIEYLGSSSVLGADVEQLLHRHDSLQTRFDDLRAGTFAEAAAPEPVVPAAPVAQQPVAQPVEAAAPQATPMESAAVPHALQMPVTVPVPMARTALALPAAMALTATRQASNQAVRVRSQLLDRLVNQAGEVMITRSRLEEELKQLRGSLGDLTGNLNRLRAQLRDIELQAETQMQSRLALAKDSAAGFDPLEFDRFTRVQELTRMMAESVNDVATVQRNIQRVVESTEDDLIAQARQTRELQRDLLRTRMVEFEGISERLYRVVRLAAKETGKQVKLDIVGGSIEMDRGVLDRMTPAFEHLLRNCVAHGVEAPALRSMRGKDPAGLIAITLHHEGNDVSVEFKDDGAGLDLPRIREKALQQGLITPEQQLTDAEAANLIFLPGFSTAAEVTELAGRGIGMDVVRSELNALGGRIETTTQSGRGTTFKLVLPLTTAVTQVVMVRSGKLAVGVPANLVELVRRAPAKEVQQAYNSGTYEFGGEQLPFFWSGALLQSSGHSTEPQGKTLPVVVFRSAAQRIAVHVDEVLGNQEVVVKNLGPQLSRLPGLAGMTVLASGSVVLIYNPVALAQVYGELARQLSVDRAQPDVLGEGVVGGNAEFVPVTPLMPVAPLIPLVLVVDDSITVRRVTQRLLQREGFRVAMAADGLQALERLAEERPAVVLSDIEMPRMDGFDLARNIRADRKLAGLPIVMITSRIAEKHRQHAKELGVNHYLGKPYSEEELLSLVKHYCSNAVPA
ncbi:Hpt domain-containing protein [Ramlibacter sp.]|uniref:Hpt domain-containing protein n=1 Tax=Ramlibacter sp. TaxID=1917967 RepID=UPI0017A09709|nr:Hpt domain-containing protein [Ramlibacter sp.]MBA2674904.1 Hpt domain-containing protein [Ramlibacter sp.]